MNVKHPLCIWRRCLFLLRKNGACQLVNWFCPTFNCMEKCTIYSLVQFKIVLSNFKFVFTIGTLLHAFSDDVEAAVFRMVGAGGESDKLVSVRCINTSIVTGFCFDAV